MPYSQPLVLQEESATERQEEQRNVWTESSERLVQQREGLEEERHPLKEAAL
jgi:hypothetical protein